MYDVRSELPVVENRRKHEVDALAIRRRRKSCYFDDNFGENEDFVCSQMTAALAEPS